MTRLEQYYRDTVAGQLQEQFAYQSPMQIPRITKITLNMGVGEASQDKKAIAGFKIREGMTIGCKVTLRRDRMYEFLDRLINFAIPRIRDFRGLSPKGFDGQGNYNMGISEQIAFPEIDYDRIDKLRGLNISITTSAGSDDEGRALLAAFQFPFRA